MSTNLPTSARPHYLDSHNVPSRSPSSIAALHLIHRVHRRLTTHSPSYAPPHQPYRQQPTVDAPSRFPLTPITIRICLSQLTPDSIMTTSCDAPCPKLGALFPHPRSLDQAPAFSSLTMPSAPSFNYAELQQLCTNGYSKTLPPQLPWPS